MSVVLAAARSWIGTPYRHQASCKGAGTDCLGLVRGVWRELAGAEPVPIPPYTADWNEAAGDEALWHQVAALLRTRDADEPTRPGDLILFRMRAGAVAKHLGIAGGAGTFIHAYAGHGVVESPLTRPWATRIVARFDLESAACP